MEISFGSHPSTNKVIATKFGTWHDSWAVVACAKFCCDMINCNWIRAKWIFHRIWIMMENSLVKWVPDADVTFHLILVWIIRMALTHWGRVTHICVRMFTITGSDNGSSPGRCQAIIWTNAGLLLIGPLGTNFSEILIEIQTFSFKKMRLKMASAKWRPFCLGLNMLIHVC